MSIFLFFKKKIDLKIEIIKLIKVKGSFIKFNVKRGEEIISKLYPSVLIMYLFTNPTSRGDVPTPNASRFVVINNMNMKNRINFRLVHTLQNSLS